MSIKVGAEGRIGQPTHRNGAQQHKAQHQGSLASRFSFFALPVSAEPKEAKQRTRKRSDASR